MISSSYLFRRLRIIINIYYYYYYYYFSKRNISILEVKVKDHNITQDTKIEYQRSVVQNEEEIKDVNHQI